MWSSTVFVVGVAVVGIMATAATFYALCDGPQRSRLAQVALSGALLVGASPFIALGLGTSSLLWMRRLIDAGMVAFCVGLAAFVSALVFSRKLLPLISVFPMLLLMAWSYLFLGVFTSGAA